MQEYNKIDNKSKNSQEQEVGKRGKRPIQDIFDSGDETTTIASSSAWERDDRSCFKWGEVLCYDQGEGKGSPYLGSCVISQNTRGGDKLSPWRLYTYEEDINPRQVSFLIYNNPQDH